MRWLRETFNFKVTLIGGRLSQSCCFVYILHLTSVRLLRLTDSHNKRTTYFSKLATMTSARSSVTPKFPNAVNTSSLASRKAFQQVALDFPLNLLVRSQPVKASNSKSAMLFSGPKTSYAAPIWILFLPD